MQENIGKLVRRHDDLFLRSSDSPPCESYILVGCFQGSQVALNPFSTSLDSLFPFKGEAQPAQTVARLTIPWSSWETPSHLGGTPPRVTNASLET
jgi:hypothetical protein